MIKKRHASTTTYVVNARFLRRQSTPSEIKLWDALRDRRLAGFKFRRQYPIDRWVIDFFCLEKMAGVEVDGSIHNILEGKEHDPFREEHLSRMGIRIFHIPADRIVSDLPSVLKEIYKFLTP